MALFLKDQRGTFTKTSILRVSAVVYHLTVHAAASLLLLILRPAMPLKCEGNFRILGLELERLKAFF